MDNSAAKVGEIFTEAGAAFNKLAEMIMMLHPTVDPNQGSQIKTVRRKAPEERPISNISNTQVTPSQNLHPGTISQQVTLNMLNAPVQEVEVETINNDVKLEFEAGTEEVGGIQT